MSNNHISEFKYLFTADCVYGEIEFDNGFLRVPVIKGLKFLGLHPLCEIYGEIAPPCLFEFREVSGYELTLFPYIGSPCDGVFGAKICSQEGAIEAEGENAPNLYEFEGVKESPPAWLDLRIVANEFRLIF